MRSLRYFQLPRLMCIQKELFRSPARIVYYYVDDVLKVQWALAQESHLVQTEDFKNDLVVAYTIDQTNYKELVGFEVRNVSRHRM